MSLDVAPTPDTKKDKCIKEIELRAPNILATISSTINIMRGGGAI
jgi:hypothetical protein